MRLSRARRGRYTPKGTLAVALGVLLLTGGCDDPQPIRIGFVAGLTGRVGDLGKEGRDAVMLAVEQANAAGGVNGRPLELLIRDDQQDSETALRVDRELLDEGVVAIVGHMTSSMAVAAVPLMNERRVLMIGPTVSTNALTGVDDYFVRVLPPNRIEAEQMARHAREQLKLESVVAVYDLGNRAYTRSWVDAFSAEFKRQGGFVVKSLTYSSSPDTRFLELAGKIHSGDADGLLVVANALDTALLLQRLRANGYQKPVMVGQWAVTRDLIPHGARAVEGVVVFHNVDPASTSPRFTRFKAGFQERFRYAPDFAGILAYDAASVLIQALRTAANFSRLKDVMVSGQEFAGLQGPISFDGFGETQPSLKLMTIRNGRLVPAS
jgi:branched-chain amino acid transport system substrate-binding protein